MGEISGVVKKYFADRGYGFLCPDDGGQDLFFHASSLKAAGIDVPEVGDRFWYRVGVNPRNQKPVAVDLRIDHEDLTVPEPEGVTGVA
jgi:CspA family cold shock protein